MEALRRPTLADQAYEELQDQIVSGQLAAGQRLMADQLAEALAISQTPVKEALARLEQEGLVEVASRRASTVRRFTQSDIEEIYEARLLIELHAATSGLARGVVTPQFVDRLAQIFREHMVFIERQSQDGLAEAIRLDRAFHEMIVSLGGNRLMSGWHRIVQRQMQTVRNYSLRQYDLGRTRREHGAIVEAFAARKRDGVVAALRAHLTASRDEILSRPPEELPIRP
ncbi:MAG: GntR family transcriptional regulator [Bauldia sp.]|nr:MAG: GntR family transcriptional regulator [Bauldia sp.]MBZ0227484.1 GntR family transcriptional regulator [Bauldia sp.]